MTITVSNNNYMLIISKYIYMYIWLTTENDYDFLWVIITIRIIAITTI